MADPRRDGPADLAAELRALGGWLDTPEPPDVRAAVRARLSTPRVRRLPVIGWRIPAPDRLRARRRRLAAAAALLVALTLAVLPPGRAAVAHAVTGLLRFAGVEVHRGQPSVRPTPDPPTPGPLPSSRSVTFGEARSLARFPVGVPARLGVPEQVLLADPAPDGAPRVVSLIYRDGVRVDEFDGRLDLGFVKTQAGPRFEWLEVAGHSGMWLPDPHELVYIDRQGVRRTDTGRLAGATLIWTDGTVTYRLEGVPSMADAVTIAESVS